MNTDALTRPFADEEIQWRPGAARYPHKDTCQGSKCREANDPANHLQLAYVEDESVMDRLDEACGIGGWQIFVEPIADGVVKVRIGVLGINDWTWYEDFGYANREGGDVLKEAVTDGIRRCGRYLGIARDLYRKGATTQAGRSSPQGRPAAPSTPRPSAPPAAGGQPEEPDWVAEQLAGEAQRVFADVAVGGACPTHNLAWTLKPGGVSKSTGKPYGAFWACPSTERPFCKEKPAEAWVARQAA